MICLGNCRGVPTGLGRGILTGYHLLEIVFKSFISITGALTTYVHKPHIYYSNGKLWVGKAYLSFNFGSEMGRGLGDG